MKRFFIIPALLLLLLVSSARAVGVLNHYDLDSLVYLSQAIVLVEISDTEPVAATGGSGIRTAKAIQVFKGPVQANTTFRVDGLEEYSRAPGIPNRPDSWDPLQKGDVVYLFLLPINEKGRTNYPLTKADWTLVASGARLLDGDNVYAFGQCVPSAGAAIGPARLTATRPALKNWSGLAAMTSITFPGALILTRLAFEEHLRQSAQTVAHVDALLAADPSPRIGAEIVQLLRDRAPVPRQELANVDALGSKLAQRLAVTASPADILTLRTGAPADVRLTLEAVLKSHVGRNYLLERVADPRETSERRLECARILSQAGWTYLNEIPKLKTGEIKSLDTDFATRLARLAVDNLGTNLAEPLLMGVASCAPASPQAKSLCPEADLQAAAEILFDAFPKAAPLDKFRIADTLMQFSSGPSQPPTRPVPPGWVDFALRQTESDLYRQLLPKAGPLLTLVEPDTDFDIALKQRTLHLTCRFRNQLNFETELRLVLRPPNGQPEIVLPISPLRGGRQVAQMTDTFGSNWRITAKLPDDAAGKYRIFLRDYLANRAFGDGLGFDLEIPPK